ncbi:DUF899 domain-containing protein [Leptolyngbya sp. CCNP1308]|uniref:DUF899 domain-containing protein n=1 Tax=Leptolyngbya sp. CCNP1308 TaxID=3110255 RepID=UPI002B21823A|nr:DUF899 domain-containing protein [Leptolyngbya sp. CCNP1308]MEA5448752.1 DUF899 domain-containing protein [Leptolyngbya sp. CCNP1308]
MTTTTLAHPPVVSADTWLAERKALLADEKALTKQRDRVNAQRRRLPMVKLEKTYRFDGPNGETTLLDLFEGRRQLLVYHFMFDPAWENGCSGCTGLVNAIGDISLLYDRDTTLALVSRAPLAKLNAYKARHQWTLPWVSSFGSDFNYDFHATLDESVAPVQYNYRDQEELANKQEQHFMTGESHGMSVFFRIEHEVFHTYSTYARGCENLTNAYSLLDITPYGRQQDFEDSPAGWPQRPTYG